MRTVILAGFVFATISVGVNGQSVKASTEKPVPRGRVTSAIERCVDQAGGRFRQAGKERWTAQVTVRDSGGTPVSGELAAIVEWPGKVRVQGPTGSATFSRGKGNSSGLDEASALAAEVLLEDTLDGFLALHLGGASTNVIGSGYPCPDNAKDACAVIGLYGVHALNPAGKGRYKQYWFDLRTNRLVRVVHGDDGADVRYSTYATVDGDEFPVSIEVRKNGVVANTISVVPGGARPSANDGIFDAN